VRDLDVFLLHIREHETQTGEEGSGDLSYFVDHWLGIRNRAQEKLVRYLEQDAYREFREIFDNFTTTPGLGARKLREKKEPRPGLIAHVVPTMVYARLADVLAYGPYIETATVERLHALRMRFKKLRYTVEFFQEVLGEPVRKVLKDIVRVQDILGELQDSQTASEMIEKYLKSFEKEQALLPVRDRISSTPMLSYLVARQNRRHEILQSFMTTWKSFDRPEFRKRLAKAISTL
jgi:CHAD domain-containing protein